MCARVRLLIARLLRNQYTRWQPIKVESLPSLLREGYRFFLYNWGKVPPFFRALWYRIPSPTIFSESQHFGFPTSHHFEFSNSTISNSNSPCIQNHGNSHKPLS
jgi:hypothetical protein